MRTIYILISLTIFISVSAVTTFAADIGMSTAIRYNWFNGHNDGSATQTLVPIRLAWEQGNFDVAVTTAYVTTTYDPESGDDYSLSGLIDTQASIGYQIVDRLPIDILLGFDINIPTGITNLSSKDIIFTQYNDQLTVSTYGEGWNFNPTIVVVKDWERFSIGAGIGYTFRGEYDFSKNTHDFDPGDRLTVSAEVAFDISQKLLSKLLITHSAYGKDQIGGTDFFREADFNLIGVSLQYIENDWNTSIHLRNIIRGKAEIIDVNGNLSSEDKKSLGDEYIVDLMYSYTINKTALNASLQHRVTAANDYNKTALAYTDKMTKTTLQIGVSRPLTDILSGYVSVAGFNLKEGHDPLFPSDKRTYVGGSVSVGVSGSF